MKLSNYEDLANRKELDGYLRYYTNASDDGYFAATGQVFPGIPQHHGSLPPARHSPRLVVLQQNVLRQSINLSYISFHFKINVCIASFYFGFDLRSKVEVMKCECQITITKFRADPWQSHNSVNFQARSPKFCMVLGQFLN